MSERWVEYTSNGGNTRTYKVVGSFVDTIMYGPRRGSKVRCLRLEKPWKKGETFAVVAAKCKDVPSPADEPSPHTVRAFDRQAEATEEYGVYEPCEIPF